MDATVLTEVAARIAGYFRDFIETDFKRVQAPSRRIVLQSESGFRAGMRLRPYESLDRDTWRLLQQPSGEPMELRFAPRKYTRALSPIVQRVISEQLAVLDPRELDAVRVDLFADIEKGYADAATDPEEWIESATDSLCEHVAEKVVRPLIARLDGPLQRQAYSVVDSLYAAETEMVTAVSAELAGKLPETLARHLAKRDDVAVKGAIETFLTPEITREALERFFAGFVTADAYLELRDLETYAAISDGMSLYLYIGACRFRNVSYPLFFLPVQAEKLPDGSGYTLTLINQVFANRSAIDFVLQELGASKARQWVSPITERINYLQPQQSVFEEANRLMGLVANAMDLAGQIRLGSAVPDAATADVSLSSSLYLCAYEKGAESLVNDYEALIDMARRGGGAVVALFEDLVRGVLQENPKSIARAVEAEWDALPLVDRMVYDSPIPLNEEQRKILMAVRHPDGRIIVVEGPPGTGKSHTITAIAADCAFNQRSCLVLSDKTEALEVVQTKLSDAMNRVRHDPNFPNPLLRLGRQDANFRKLVGNQTVNQVAAYAKATSANAVHIEQERQSTAQEMKAAIEKTVESLGSIELQKIQKLQERESHLGRRTPEVLAAIHALSGEEGLSTRLAAFIDAIDQTAAYFGALPDARRNVQWLRRRADRDHVLSEFAREHRRALTVMSMFEALDAQEVRDVNAMVLQYRQLRMPMFGYFFRGARVRAIETRLNALPVRRPIMMKTDADELVIATQGANELRVRLEKIGLGEGLKDGWRQAVSGLPDGKAPGALLTLIDSLSQHRAILEDIISGTPEYLKDVAAYLYDWAKVREAFRKAPEFDYVGTKTKMERLNTSRMNAHVDSRLVGFMENHRADAKTLAQLIARRQKFPEEKFDAVRSSFPIIIAGIREFGEYMPLVPELFDVVVIDEASQVSVAQALPAILRAKKVVVLGDSKQFANVKSSTASIATNEKYRANLVSFFESTVRRDAGTLQRLASFDVKKSILEFCSLTASYAITLRKHFRSFPELISYSSRHFYDGHLQAIRIRGVPVDEVIRFDQVDPTGKAVSRTTNTAEADFIAERLVELLEEDEPPTVGVITPFREQHTLLTKMLFRHERAQEFEDKLRLKVMTFDSCQGEERSIVFYSMVATPGNDALNYVFPVSLDATTLEAVEEKLKVQRLNVGFSRAQDVVWIVHSMPLPLFRGSVGQALSHYARIRDSRLGSTQATDPTSPMEAKVLGWLQSTRFVQAQPEDVEIVPQFPLGEYLQQLDRTYVHPAYRVDFLVTCRTEKGVVQIVVEYDGFEHHFRRDAQVHVGNHERYLRSEDVERQLTLESYGYRFVRINRFNLGADPVATLDDRLAKIVEVATGEQHSRFVERLREQAEGIVSGDMKQCTRCKVIKSVDDFYDKELRAGEGGYGRVCTPCKASDTSKPVARRAASGWRRRRRW